jgi:hypothetical protein
MQDMIRSPSPNAPPETSHVKPTLTFFGTIPSHSQSLSQRLHNRLQGEGILVDGIPKMDTLTNFNSNGTQARSPPRDAEASFSVRLFHTPSSVGTRLQLEKESLP